MLITSRGNQSRWRRQMDYYSRSQLPILSFDTAPEALEREDVRRILCEKPCNIVFVEVCGKLYGIVSRGDVSRAKRAGEERIPINRSYSFIVGKQFMAAREIFRGKKTIQEIPVIDREGRLMGMCSRTDDLLYLEYLEYSNPWESNRYIRPYLEQLKRVLFVRAPQGDMRREKIIDQWIREFTKCGVHCELIDFAELPGRQDAKATILIVDEETNKGGYFVTEALDGSVYRSDYVHTFRTYERFMSDPSYDELIQKMADFGIKVYNLYYSEDENTEGRRRLWNGMRQWLEQPEARNVNPHVTPSSAQGFYGELNKGTYAAEVGKLYFGMEASSVYTRMKDIQSRYLNIVNGERVTIGQPAEADRTIWFFGPCITIGGFVEDQYTIESILQKKINEAGFSFKVVNCGCHGTPYQEIIRITSTPMKPGDIIVVFVDNRPIAGTESVDMTEILDKNNAPVEWLLDTPAHCNHKVNMLYANELFERMQREGVLSAEVQQTEHPVMLTRDLAVNSLYLDLCFNSFHPKEGQTVGGIGMHGNPFTRGHRYLIETASKMVDWLICQIIEDEPGAFSFAERFAMAVEGTRDLPNVRIVAGGPFQATRNVFQEYFLRVEPADMRESATVDTLIFAENIAKRLGITYRFLGDEKHNPKMQFFNELVKEILPHYGIHVVEIPRLQAGDRPISASSARDAAAVGDRETLLQYVPETTLPFMIGGGEQ